MGKTFEDVGDHQVIISSVAIVEDSRGRDGQGLEGANVVEDSHAEPLQLSVIDDSADVDGLAGVANAGADGQGDIMFIMVSFDGLVQVVGDSGSIRGFDEESASIDQRTMQETDGTLDNGLDVTAVAPQTGWRVRFTQKWRMFQDLVEEICIAAVEQGPLRDAIDVQKLEQEAEDDSDDNKDVHFLRQNVAKGPLDIVAADWPAMQIR